jgi:hypothetical protein
MDFFRQLSGGPGGLRLLGHPAYTASQEGCSACRYTEGMYNNMVHIATNIL